MKKISLLFVMILFINSVFSQTSNLVFFNQEGYRFFVILNGVKMNSTAQTNVKITDLPLPNYKAKIIFEDNTLGEVNKALNFTPGNETVFQIKKNNKNEWVVRWQSEIPVAQAPPAVMGQTMIVYNPNGITTPNGTTTTTTIKTTNESAPNFNANLNMNMNVPGANLNLNINAPDMNSSSTTTTTTTTTTTVNGDPHPSNNNHQNFNNNPPPPHNDQHPGTNHSTQPPKKVYKMQGYNGPVGCSWPVSDPDFSNMKNSISSKSFDDTKLTISKQIISSNCLLTKQVKEIMLLFSFEATRLEFAKFAYGYTYDIGNFYMLNDAFQFESSIDELNKYINTRK